MSKRKKSVKNQTVDGRKIPKQTENPESFYGRNPVWSFKQLDKENKKWGLACVENLYSAIILKLVDIEGLTWGEIIKATGGRRQGNNNHYENVSDLCDEAQVRWRELNLDEFDKVFSLRLTNKQRLYGILLDGIFRIIWFDSKHEIYPVSN